MASHVLGWIGGTCIFAFVAVGIWMSLPVMGNPFAQPTPSERDEFTTRRARIPFGLWFGLGIVGIAVATLAVALR